MFWDEIAVFCYLNYKSILCQRGKDPSSVVFYMMSFNMFRKSKEEKCFKVENDFLHIQQWSEANVSKNTGVDPLDCT